MRTVVPIVGTFVSGGVNNSYIGRLTYGLDDPTQLITPVPATSFSVFSPAISRDNERVAYIAQGPSTNGDIWVVGVAGGGETIVYTAATGADEPQQAVWTAAGRIVFTTFGPNIYVMDADGGNLTTLYTDPSARDVANLQVSADGSKIAFQVLLSASSRGNWTMNADGTGAVQVSTSPTQFSGLIDNANATSWASGSNTLVYKGGTVAAPTLRKINADGTGDLLLGSTIAQAAPAGDRWSPDDSFVVYLADALTDLRKFATDGSGDSLLFADTGAYDSYMFRAIDRLYLDRGADIVSLLYDGSDWQNHTTGSTDSFNLT